VGVRVKGWAQIRLRILSRDGYTCHYCRGEATEVDHVIPRALGGGEDDDNLVAACVPCNRSKGKRIAPKQSRPFFLDTIGHPPAGMIVPPMRKLGPPEAGLNCE
jgi:5-methylcytosine-specific restriction endonuclease McrA